MKQLVSPFVTELFFNKSYGMPKQNFHPITVANKILCIGIAILLLSCSRPSNELVLEETDFNHFIGRIASDPKALNGRSMWLDPLIAGSPPVTLDAGDYTFYLYARCLARTSTPVCRLKIVQTNSQTILFTRDVAREIFGDGSSYALVEWPFTLDRQTTLQFDVDMLISGKEDFYLDSIGFAGPQGLTRWNNSLLKHHVGVEMDDPLAIDGKAWTNAHALAYGPYIALSKPGRYEAIYRFAIAPNFNAESIATLDVYSHYGHFDGGTGNKTYAIRGLSTSDFAAPDEFIEISLPFEYDGAEGMEFRVLVYYVIRDALRLDRITVRPIEEPDPKVRPG